MTAIFTISAPVGAVNLCPDFICRLVFRFWRNQETCESDFLFANFFKLTLAPHVGRRVSNRMPIPQIALPRALDVTARIDGAVPTWPRQNAIYVKVKMRRYSESSVLLVSRTK